MQLNKAGKRASKDLAKKPPERADIYAIPVNMYMVYACMHEYICIKIYMLYR